MACDPLRNETCGVRFVIIGILVAILCALVISFLLAIFTDIFRPCMPCGRTVCDKSMIEETTS